MKKIILILATCFTLSANSQTSMGSSGTVSGSGTASFVPVFTANKKIGNSKIFTSSLNGITVFDSSLDGTGSGTSNMTYTTSVGGYLLDFKSQTSNSIRFLDGGSLKMQINSIGGYNSINSKYRFALKAIDTGKNHFWLESGTGFIGMGDDYFVPSARLHIYQPTASTSAKALSVNTLSGELLSIDDNTYTNFYGLGFNVNGYGGNANMNLLSSSGAYDPTLTFKYNGGSTSGTISGSSSSLWIRPTGNLLISQTYANPTSIIQVVGLVEYADNAAAITAGLTVGAFYRTGDLLKVVH